MERAQAKRSAIVSKRRPARTRILAGPWLEVGPHEEGRLRECRPQVSMCAGLTGLARLCMGGMMLKLS
jgi:hypothetical protein